MASYRQGTLTARDGVALYYRDYGDVLSRRTPVLCLTGLTRNSADFADLAEHLSRERRVICPDYRGRGRSGYDRNWRNYEPRVYLDDIGHLLAATGIGRVVVIGTSLGGILAMGLSVLRPTVMAGVVLNDIGPDIAHDGLGRIMEQIGRDHPQPDWESAIRHLQRELPDLSVRTEAGWLKIARATFREGEDGLLHFDWDTNLVKSLMAQRGELPDLWPYFRALRRLPALALRGLASDVLTAATFERMAQEKPDLRRVGVPQAGHAPTLGEPEAMAAIDDFLAPL